MKRHGAGRTVPWVTRPGAGTAYVNWPEYREIGKGVNIAGPKRGKGRTGKPQLAWLEISVWSGL